MASLQIDPSGNYHVKFRFAGKQYRRSLRTKMRRTAEASACHIEENIRLIEGGRLELPEDADVPTFLLSDGKLLGKPLPTSAITVGTIFDKYQKSIPADAMEATSLKTARIHMRHFQRLMGANKNHNGRPADVCDETLKGTGASRNNQCSDDPERNCHTQLTLELGNCSGRNHKAVSSQRHRVSKANGKATVPNRQAD